MKFNEQLAGICTGVSKIWRACSSELHCNMFQEVFGKHYSEAGLHACGITKGHIPHTLAQ